MSHTGPSMGSQNEDLDVLITRIQGFLEERGYESPIIRQLRAREMDQEAREKDLAKRERALEIREQALAEMEARCLGSSLRYVCDYCHAKICGRGTSCGRHKLIAVIAATGSGRKENLNVPAVEREDPSLLLTLSRWTRWPCLAVHVQ